MHFFRPLVGTLLHTFGVYQKYVARPGDRGAQCDWQAELMQSKAELYAARPGDRGAKATEGQRLQRGKGYRGAKAKKRILEWYTKSTVDKRPKI